MGYLFPLFTAFLTTSMMYLDKETSSLAALILAILTTSAGKLRM